MVSSQTNIITNTVRGDVQFELSVTVQDRRKQDEKSRESGYTVQETTVQNQLVIWWKHPTRWHPWNEGAFGSELDFNNNNLYSFSL